MISEADLQTLLRNQEIARGSFIPGIAPTKRRGRMNKWETAYSQSLAADSNVVWWDFEPISFRLAEGAKYTPDFAAIVIGVPAELVLFEVKGFWREAARVRIKVAADKYPFRFIAVTRAKGGEWQYEHIAGRA